MSHWRDLLMLNKLRAPVGICGFSSAFGSAFYTLFNPQIRSPQIRILPVAPWRSD